MLSIIKWPRYSVNRYTYVLLKRQQQYNDNKTFRLLVQHYSNFISRVPSVANYPRQNRGLGECNNS